MTRPHDQRQNQDPRRGVTNRPVYLAIGIDCAGRKQVLGLWVGPTTGDRPSSGCRYCPS
jgi:hypothetical protein